MSEAVFFDGVSAKPQPASVRVEAGTLVILSADGAALAHWPADRIARVRGTGYALSLLLDGGGGARLHIEDSGLAHRLRAALPSIERRDRLDRNRRRKIAILVPSAVLSVAAVIAVGLPWAARAVAPAVPMSVEERIGRSVTGQVAALLGFDPQGDNDCADPEGLAVLERMMAMNAEDGGSAGDARLRVINHPMPNAMALPGGTVFLFNGLIDKAENPDEIFGVLAHEVGHVAHRHVMRRIIEAGSLSLVFSTIFGDVTGGTGVAVLAQLLLSSSYSRDMEREADLFAGERMVANGADPVALGRLLQRVAPANAAREATSLISSHPMSAERLDALAALVEGDASTAPLFDDDDWRALRAICEGTPPASAEPDMWKLWTGGR